MPRRAPGFYAFRLQSPALGDLPALVRSGRRLRVRGELFRFDSQQARQDWLEAGVGLPGEQRLACRFRELPAGWGWRDAIEVSGTPPRRS